MFFVVIGMEEGKKFLFSYSLPYRKESSNFFLIFFVRRYFECWKLKSFITSNNHNRNITINSKMATISWNDIPDDDSSISDLSEDSAHQNQKLQDNTQNSKVTSQPIEKVKELPPKTIENLNKLQKHEGKTVWLYITGYQRSQQSQIDSIINNMNFVQQKRRKQYKSNNGRNILVEVDRAKDLIQNGFQENEVNLKFFYSHLNEKFSSEGNVEERNLRSPQNKLPSSRNTRSKGKYKEKNVWEEKKKIKYIAKEQIKEPETNKKEENNKVSKKNSQTQILKISVEQSANNKAVETKKQDRKEEYEVKASKKKRKQKNTNAGKPKKLAIESHNPFSFFDE